MPRSSTLERIEKTLRARRNELARRLDNELEDLGYSSTSGDSVDAAFENTSEELTCQLAELEANELAQIDLALTRLKQGKYGTCDACNCKIAMVRLNALPYSTLCIKCQREAENDSNWLSDRIAENWSNLRDGNDDREVNLSDLEIDYTK